jgi:hypothetical protein
MNFQISRNNNNKTQEAYIERDKLNITQPRISKHNFLMKKKK